MVHELQRRAHGERRNVLSEHPCARVREDAYAPDELATAFIHIETVRGSGVGGGDGGVDVADADADAVVEGHYVAVGEHAGGEFGGKGFSECGWDDLNGVRFFPLEKTVDDVFDCAAEEFAVRCSLCAVFPCAHGFDAFHHAGHIDHDIEEPVPSTLGVFGPRYRLPGLLG